MSLRRLAPAVALILVAVASLVAEPASAGHRRRHHRARVRVHLHTHACGHHWRPVIIQTRAVKVSSPNLAYIDVDVKPEEVEVWLDGAEVGIADDFDGDPRYLTTKPGKHLLEFRLDDLPPVQQEVDLRPGVVVGIETDVEEAAEEK